LALCWIIFITVVLSWLRKVAHTHTYTLELHATCLLTTATPPNVELALEIAMDTLLTNPGVGVSLVICMSTHRHIGTHVCAYMQTL